MGIGGGLLGGEGEFFYWFIGCGMMIFFDNLRLDCYHCDRYEEIHVHFSFDPLYLPGIIGSFSIK